MLIEISVLMLIAKNLNKRETKNNKKIRNQYKKLKEI
jgi:hypothetical protein